LVQFAAELCRQFIAKKQEAVMDPRKIEVCFGTLRKNQAADTFYLERAGKHTLEIALTEFDQEPAYRALEAFVGKEVSMKGFIASGNAVLFTSVSQTADYTDTAQANKKDLRPAPPRP
jgi:hypothetical protein